MGKRVSNKRLKQMIFDVAMQGRKLFWFGEETEMFLAKSEKAVKAEYYDPSMDDDWQQCEQMKTNSKVMWRKVPSDYPLGGATKPADKSYYRVPWISFVRPHSDRNPAQQMLTCYN